MNAKQDNNDVGYCLQITPVGINVAKIFRHDPRINSQQAFHYFIKCLVDNDKRHSLSKFTLGNAHIQFFDPSIDIFFDENSILKDLPLVATTSRKLPLHGNVCVVGSDKKGNSILLTESQITKVLQELDFPEHPYVNQIDLTDLNSLVNDTQDEASTLRKLLEALVTHCVENEVQLVTRAKAISKDTDDAVLIVCLYGNDKAIKQLHTKVEKLIRNCELGNKDETFN